MEKQLTVNEIISLLEATGKTSIVGWDKLDNQDSVDYLTSEYQGDSRTSKLGVIELEEQLIIFPAK